METDSTYAPSFLTSVWPKKPLLILGCVTEAPYLSSHPSLQSQNYTCLKQLAFSIVDKSVNK